MKLEDELSDLKEITDILSFPSIAIDLVTSLCGEEIGCGSFRCVYDYNLDKKYVIKLEAENTNCNLIEYMIWQEVKGLKRELAWVKNWFAPVKWISPNGKLLVMEKTQKKKKRKKPKKVPAFLWDVKEENFGWIGDNYVCHDYGQFYNFISYSDKMKKVDWNLNDVKINTLNLTKEYRKVKIRK